MSMITGKKIILYGAGDFGETALDYFGFANVRYFADKYKAGKYFFGKNIISVDELREIQDDYDVVICLVPWVTREVERELKENGIRNPIQFHNVRNAGEKFPDPSIVAFKDKHKGERCFLIGNGPSLRSEHLDLLHDAKEVTFACNWIFKAFESTNWRPDYYFCSDRAFIKFNIDKALSVPAKAKFFADYVGYQTMKRLTFRDESACVFHVFVPAYYDIVAEFSPDPSVHAGIGNTIMYPMMQFAAYMGFSEIYLLGVDCTSQNLLKEAEAGARIHFYDSHEAVEQHKAILGYSRSRELDTKTKQRLTFAEYETAEAYAQSHGFKILNATVGGELEVFERVDFMSLF